MYNSEDWEKYFIETFNEAYGDYLNNLSPEYFMKNYLNKIIKITNSESGYIAGYYESNNAKYLIIDVYTNNDNIYIINKSKIDITNNDSFCAKAINKKKIKIKIINNYNHISIPFFWENKVMGVIGLSNNNGNIYKSENIKYFKNLANFTAMLYNNYNKISLIKEDEKTINNIIDNILDDILNITNNAIIVLNNNFGIIYYNKLTNELLEIESNKQYIYEFIGEIQKSLDTHNLEPEKRIFRNKKIELNTEELYYEIIINTTINLNKIYHIINISKKIKNEYKRTNIITYLSHELRNPLQSINLAGYLLKCDIKNQINNRLLDHIEIINKSSNDMKKIINDILDLAKIDANEFSIEYETINIEDIIDNIHTEYDIIANEKGLSFNVQINKDIPTYIYTDQTRLCQIITNLITNAIKYSEKGEIIMKIYTNNDNIIFDITDNGIGIKENEFDKLFKDFGQTSNSNKLERMSSTGLGLCISQKIANLLGGYITVKSQYGYGSTFLLYHPLKLCNSGIYSEKDIDIYNLSGNILLVDDNEYNVNLLQMMLQNFNYEYNASFKIESVNNGKEAIKLAKINKYDIIFMDINMSGIDGYTAGKIIKKNNYEGKIIATTGDIMLSPENRLNYDSSKIKCFDDIIIKPFSDISILKRLHKYLKVESPLKHNNILFDT